MKRAHVIRTLLAAAVLLVGSSPLTARLAAAAGPLDHFLCYEGRRPALGLKGVSAADQFGASTITVRQAKRLCAPVNKNGEDPTAPTHPGHLSFYTIKQTAPRFVGTRNVSVRDQFGTLTVDLVRPERLLVPTSKSLQAPPPPPLATPLDHYKCYRVRGARLRVPNVTVETQFGPLVVAIKRPRDLCVPVDKNGEGIIDPSRGLMCYQVRTAPQGERHVFTTDQFGSADYDLFGVRDLCVPLLAGPGTCGDGAINAPGERCETGLGNDAACPGACDTATCTCTGTPPVCGNGVAESGEQCDGTDAAACPGLCTATCTCPAAPVCGNGVVDPGEQCDGTTDTACPGRCNTLACTCNPVAGQCDGQADGAPCNDANACTASDTCQSGTCTGSAPVVCAAASQCHDAGTCDHATGICSNPPKPAGSTCNDANACTTSDTCQSGTCIGANPVACSPASQCHDAGTCDPATGACSNPPKTAGSGCSDGNACTQGDTCNAGVCGSGTPLTGTTCDDGSLCTSNDTCQNGTCTGAAQCDALCGECVLTCDPATGQCLNVNAPDGTPCGGAIDPQCGQPSSCQDGQCVADLVPDYTPCDDGKVCTLSDSCRAGACVGNQKNCDDRNALNADTCDPATGACVYTPDPSRAATCSACTTTRCCRQPDGDGGLELTCVGLPLVCEDTTGTVGASCGVAPDRFVCPLGTTCCGNDVCCPTQAGSQCYEGTCYASPGSLCGNTLCRAFGETCVDDVCVPTCGAGSQVCSGSEQCCGVIGKCCGLDQVCGVSDCEAPVTCGPGEVHVQNECCLEASVCGQGLECCAATEYCDQCTQECRPRP